MTKMKPGAKVNALMLAVSAFTFAQQGMGFLLKVIRGTHDTTEYVLATVLPAAALFVAIMAVIKAIPQPVQEENEKAGSDGPVK